MAPAKIKRNHGLVRDADFDLDTDTSRGNEHNILAEEMHSPKLQPIFTVARVRALLT